VDAAETTRKSNVVIYDIHQYAIHGIAVRGGRLSHVERRCTGGDGDQYRLRGPGMCTGGGNGGGGGCGCGGGGSGACRGGYNRFGSVCIS